MDWWMGITMLSFTCVAMTTAQHCQITFVSEKGYYLQNCNLIDPFSADVMTCATRCTQHPFCKSFSYGIKGQERGQCTLKNAARGSTNCQYLPNVNTAHYQLFIEHDRGKNALQHNGDSDGVCSIERCLNNGTCIDTCDANRFKCNCLPTNSGQVCEIWKGNLSDFDVLFPTRSTENYIEQRLTTNNQSDTRTSYNAISVVVWVRVPVVPGSQQTVLSIARPGDSRTVFYIRLKEAINVTGRVSVDAGIWGENLQNHRPVGVRIWSLVVVTWHSDAGRTFRIKTPDGTIYGKWFKYGWTIPRESRVIVGQEMLPDGSGRDPNRAFVGRISRLNIWSYDIGFNDAYIEYKTGTLVTNANMLPWPRFWDYNNITLIHGKVKKIVLTEVKRGDWEEIAKASVQLRNDSVDVSINSTGEVKPEISASMTRSCDLETKPAALFVLVTGEWRKIKYKICFEGQFECFGVFGGRLEGSSLSSAGGLVPWDEAHDVVIDEKYMGGDSGKLSGCGTNHFWYANPGSTRCRKLTQRREADAKEAGIAVFAKCGSGSIRIYPKYTIA